VNIGWLSAGLLVVCLVGFGCGGPGQSSATSEASSSPTPAGEAAPTSRALAATVIQGWDLTPTITIVAAPGDPRIGLVQDATKFWNGQFEELGSPFRLGEISQAERQVPGGPLIKLSDAILNGRFDQAAFLETTHGLTGNIIIFLTDENLISFTSIFSSRRQVVIGIRTNRGLPFTLPNVARNVIAHEMGHAIGLQHNSDATKLMCGRPAACRPDAFASSEPRFFPLTDEDRVRLLRLYPTTWAPR
jgi:hypothetical protein